MEHPRMDRNSDVVGAQVLLFEPPSHSIVLTGITRSESPRSYRISWSGGGVFGDVSLRLRPDATSEFGKRYYTYSK